MLGPMARPATMIQNATTSHFVVFRRGSRDSRPTPEVSGLS
jgi:hypothetical protein